MEKKYIIFTAKIEENLKPRLKIASAKSGIPMQDLLNQFLKEGLEKFEQELKN